MMDHPLLADLVPLAVQAGTQIVACRSEAEANPKTKNDGSLVTIADQRAEEVILAGLKACRPQIPVVAEEHVAEHGVPWASDQTPGCFFLVDPLDGTREFASGRDEFTVNIALIENGAPSVGVVWVPPLQVGFAGAEGDAYTFRADGTGAVLDAQPIAARARPTELCAVVSRSHASQETLTFLERFAISERVQFGSSLKICRIAEGAADIYPRHGRTMEWDTAAGDAVLRNAGGHLLTFDGQPLQYGKLAQADDSAFANPYFVAVGAWTREQRRDLAL